MKANPKDHLKKEKNENETIGEGKPDTLASEHPRNDTADSPSDFKEGAD